MRGFIFCIIVVFLSGCQSVSGARNKEAQSAIETITESIKGQSRIVKYCPLTGKHYAAHLKVCPTHKVSLKVVED